jgi:hypothetical protein
MTPRELLEGVAKAADAIGTVFQREPSALGEKEIEEIQNIIVKLRRILTKRAAELNWRAIKALADLAILETEFLRNLSEIPDHERVIKSVAKAFPEWPVAVTQQGRSLEDAKRYLHRIGVGTESTPATASMNASAERRWRGAARELFEEIEAIRDFHQGEQDSPLLREIRRQPAFAAKANTWREKVLSLPPRKKTKKSLEKWWAVADQILDPSRFIDDSIRKKATDDFRRAEGYVRKAVKRAFEKMFFHR